MFDLLASGIVNIVQFKYLIPLAIGTLIGVVGGALPGITITMTVIVVLPFTFGLEPLQGLAAMIALRMTMNTICVIPKTTFCREPIPSARMKTGSRMDCGIERDNCNSGLTAR